MAHNGLFSPEINLSFVAILEMQDPSIVFGFLKKKGH